MERALIAILKGEAIFELSDSGSEMRAQVIRMSKAFRTEIALKRDCVCFCVRFDSLGDAPNR